MIKTLLTVSTLALGLSAPHAKAQALELEDVLQAEILPGWTTRNGTHMAGLRLRLAPGWKTYWRAPGDMGIPPSFSFAASENLRGIAIHWPRPDVFDQSGAKSIGYGGDLVIPIELAPQEAGQDITLDIAADLGVCDDICVPVSLSLSAEIPAEASKRTPAIAAALMDRPTSSASAGVGRVACKISPTEKGLTVSATIDMPSAGRGEFAVFEHPDPSVWVAQSQTQRIGGQLIASTRMVPTSGDALLMDRSALTITILAEGNAVEIQGCPAG